MTNIGANLRSLHLPPATCHLRLATCHLQTRLAAFASLRELFIRVGEQSFMAPDRAEVETLARFFASYWSLAKLISVAFYAIFQHELNEFGEFSLFFFVKFAFIRVKIRKRQCPASYLDPPTGRKTKRALNLRLR